MKEKKIASKTVIIGKRSTLIKITKPIPSRCDKLLAPKGLPRISIIPVPVVARNSVNISHIVYRLSFSDIFLIRLALHEPILLNICFIIISPPIKSHSLSIIQHLEQIYLYKIYPIFKNIVVSQLPHARFYPNKKQPNVTHSLV